jgi:chemotaxis family two-component system sensor kinase Cph1
MKLSRQALAESEQRLRRRSDQLALSNRELEQFAYVASHDLQEPLRMVSSYLQLLEQRYRDELDDSAREFIDFAVEGSKRMKQMIEDLLRLSRVATRGRPPKSCSSKTALEAACLNLKLAIEDANAVIDSGPLPSVRADENQLAQVFQNLIENAIKFRGEQSPRVVIGASTEQPKMVCFSVQDNGIGIEHDYAHKIFDVFARLHHRDHYTGSGIGLSICKKIIERHGGRIWVEPVANTGAHICFTLPKAGQEDAANDGH